MNEPIDYCCTIADYERVPYTDSSSYTLRTDRPAKWLQRLAIWALHKLGCRRVSYTSHVVEHRIEASKLHHFLRQAFNEIHNRYAWDKSFASRPTVLIGYETVKRFVYGPEFTELSVNIPYQPCFGPSFSKWTQGEYVGFRLVVLPWFKEGVVILPSDL